MEDGLVLIERINANKADGAVLILVVMEDGLVLLNVFIITSYSPTMVLILVVMEDGLVHVHSMVMTMSLWS